MPATIVQKNSAAQNTAATSFAVTLPSPAVAGNEIIIIVASDSYFNGPPTGFTEPTGARQERYLGHYVWHKTAVGGEQSITITPQLSSTLVWAVFEVSGLSGVGSLIASAGQSAVLAGSRLYSTPTLTLTAGERFVIGSIGGSSAIAGSTTSGWTNGFTEEADLFTTLSSGTRDSLGVAVYQGTFSAGQTISTSTTADTSPAPESQTGIILAFNIGGTDTEAPTVPQNLHVQRRKASSLKIQWSPSTDNVIVSGYHVQVNGTVVATTTSTTTTYTLSGLTEDTEYTVRVRAFDSANNNSAYSTALTVMTLEGSGRYYWSGDSKHLLNPSNVDPATHYTLLPRVVWEGGPAYYNSIPALVGTEWTQNTFFPIGYWGAYVNEENVINRYADLGVNTLWTTYATVDNSASWIRNAGLYNMGGTLPGSGSEHLGHVVEDEVDMWAGSGWGEWTGATGFVPNVCASGQGDCGYTIMHATEEDLPDDGKLRWTNYGLGVLSYMNDQAGSDYVSGITSNGSWPMHLVTGDMYFYTGGGTMSANLELYFGRPGATAQRAGNYGELIMTKLRHLDGIKGTRKPLGVVVELGGQMAKGENMTPDRVEGAVWSTIIHEARCISYFSHAFADTTQNPWSSNVLTSNGGLYPQITARVGQINSQVTQLAPVLNTQSYQWTGASNIASMLKIHGGFAYIFAMAKVELNHSSAPRAFRLPYGISGKSVEVMFENRTLEVTNGAIVDSFALETTHHIYKVAL